MVRRRRPWLDPQEWTYEQLYRYLRVTKGMARSTAECRIRYLRFLERPRSKGGWGLNLHQDPDDAYMEFFDYVLERRDTEDDPEDALNNSQKAVKSLFEALGVKGGYEWVRIRRKKREKQVYDDQTAYEIINGEYRDDPAANATLQHLFHYGHYVGPRPSELLTLKVSDINWKERKVTIRERKTRKVRAVIVEDFVINSPVDKSLWNYFVNWRPKLQKRSGYDGDVFWLNGKGHPVSYNMGRQQLSKAGKQVCSYFHPHLMRSFCITWRLIWSYWQTGVFDIIGVNMFIDHGSLDQTAEYTRIAEKYIREWQQKPKMGRIRAGRMEGRNNA